MKKRINIFDTIMYLIIILAPLNILAVVGISKGYADVQAMLTDCTGIFAGTDLYESIIGVIGSNGVAPLLNEQTNIFADYITYAVYVTMIHLIIDCLAFIPACAHKLLDKLGGDWFD